MKTKLAPSQTSPTLNQPGDFHALPRACTAMSFLTWHLGRYFLVGNLFTLSTPARPQLQDSYAAALPTATKTSLLLMRNTVGHQATRRKAISLGFWAEMLHLLAFKRECSQNWALKSHAVVGGGVGPDLLEDWLLYQSTM